MLFQLGQTVITRTALSVSEDFKIDVVRLLRRHHGGDWGDLCIEDVEANVQAIQHGGRILSKYKDKGQSFYVITEADRSSTCLMLVEDY